MRKIVALCGLAAFPALTSCTALGGVDQEQFMALSESVASVREALESDTATPADVALAVTGAVATVTAIAAETKENLGATVAALEAQVDALKDEGQGIVGVVKEKPAESILTILAGLLAAWTAAKAADKGAAKVVEERVAARVNAERDGRRKERGEKV